MELRVGDSVPLVLQLFDGNVSQFPQAKVYDNAGNLLTTLNLTHVALGLYTNETYIMPNKPHIYINYVTYSDAGHTTENLMYNRAIDEFILNLNASQTSVNAVPTAAQNADAVWDEDLATHSIAGSAGKIVTNILKRIGILIGLKFT